MDDVFENWLVGKYDPEKRAQKLLKTKLEHLNNKGFSAFLDELLVVTDEVSAKRRMTYKYSCISFPKWDKCFKELEALWHKLPSEAGDSDKNIILQEFLTKLRSPHR
jgi:hypothetical protein